MKKIFALLLASALVFSCQKEPVKQECEINKTFTLNVTNKTADPFYIYVNQNYVTTVESGKTFTDSKSPTVTFELELLNINNTDDLRIVNISQASCTVKNLSIE